MKKTNLKVATDGEAATASQDANAVPADRLLTVDDVAARLQVKARTVYKWVHERYIPSVKLGALIRFDQASVAVWVKKRERPGRLVRRVEVDLD